jgi:hypothetical protein
MNDKQQAQIYSKCDLKSSSAGAIAFYFLSTSAHYGNWYQPLNKASTNS